MQSFSLFWTIIIYGSVICLICLFPRSRKFYRRAFDFNVLKEPKTYQFIIIAFLAIFIANLVIFNRSLSSTFDLLTSDFSLTALLKGMELFQFILYIVIIAPIMEEMLFRIPLSILMNKKTYFIIGLLISSVLFAFLHPDYPLFGFTLGVTLGIIFKLSNSIVPAILLHIIWNVFSLFYYNYI